MKELTYLYCALHPDKPKTWKRKNQIDIGFCGINCALIYLFASMNPSAGLRVMGIDTNSKSALKWLVIFDCVGLIVDNFFKPTGISHSGHLGGVFGGWIAKYMLCNSTRARKCLNLTANVLHKHNFCKNKL